MTLPSERPSASDHAPFYTGYVARVPETDVLAALAAQAGEVRALAAAVPADHETFRYGPGKWSVREVFGHLIDAERVFGYRALAIARGDQTPLPGFDEQAYVPAGAFDRFPLTELAEELAAARESNLHLLRRLDEEAWRRRGVANANPVTVTAIAYILAGHVRHHLAILAERYGVGSIEP